MGESTQQFFCLSADGVPSNPSSIDTDDSVPPQCLLTLELLILLIPTLLPCWCSFAVCIFLGAGRQWLWTGSGLVGPGCRHVWNDVRPPAFLQPRPREAVWAHPYGRYPLSSQPGAWWTVSAHRLAQERPQAEVCDHLLPVSSRTDLGNWDKPAHLQYTMVSDGIPVMFWRSSQSIFLFFLDIWSMGHTLKWNYDLVARGKKNMYGTVFSTPLCPAG